VLVLDFEVRISDLARAVPLVFVGQAQAWADYAGGGMLIVFWHAGQLRLRPTHPRLAPSFCPHRGQKNLKLSSAAGAAAFSTTGTAERVGGAVRGGTSVIFICFGGGGTYNV